MRPRGRSAGRHALAVLKAGDRKAGELARDGTVDAVLDRALKGGFGGSAALALDPLLALSQLTHG